VRIPRCRRVRAAVTELKIFGNTGGGGGRAGTPVIVTENCGVAALLAEAGKDRSARRGALVKALAELLQNETLRERLGARAVSCGEIQLEETGEPSRGLL